MNRLWSFLEQNCKFSLKDFGELEFDYFLNVFFFMCNFVYIDEYTVCVNFAYLVKYALLQDLDLRVLSYMCFLENVISLFHFLCLAKFAILIKKRVFVSEQIATIFTLINFRFGELRLLRWASR